MVCSSSHTIRFCFKPLTWLKACFLLAIPTLNSLTLTPCPAVPTFQIAKSDLSCHLQNVLLKNHVGNDRSSVDSINLVEVLERFLPYLGIVGVARHAAMYSREQSILSTRSLNTTELTSARIQDYYISHMVGSWLAQKMLSCGLTCSIHFIHELLHQHFVPLGSKAGRGSVSDIYHAYMWVVTETAIDEGRLSEIFAFSNSLPDTRVSAELRSELFLANHGIGHGLTKHMEGRRVGSANMPKLFSTTFTTHRLKSLNDLALQVSSKKYMAGGIFHSIYHEMRLSQRETMHLNESCSADLAKHAFVMCLHVVVYFIPIRFYAKEVDLGSWTHSASLRWVCDFKICDFCGVRRPLGIINSFATLKVQCEKDYLKGWHRSICTRLVHAISMSLVNTTRCSVTPLPAPHAYIIFGNIL